MTTDETHRMTLPEIAALAKAAGLKVQADDRTPYRLGSTAHVISTANGNLADRVANADPVALAIGRRKRDR